MAEMQDIFHDSDRITLDILKEGAENYLFNDAMQNDSSQIDSEMKIEIYTSQRIPVDLREENFDAFESDERITELEIFNEQFKNLREKRDTGLKVGDFHNSSDFRQDIFRISKPN